MKQEVHEIKIVCQVFYVLAHILALLLLFFTRNPLTLISWETFLFWLIKFLALFQFFRVGSSPGSPIDSPKSLVNELQETDWNIPAHSLCEPCNMTQPYRAKHCFSCESCISKFDHHCFWIGACVGELNHFRFVAYLITESICLVWAFFYCFHGNSLLELIFYAILGITCAGFAVLTVGLGGFHVYLISIGSTTWEILRRKSIEYLKPYPYNFHPFSKGFFKNWEECFKANEVKIWVLPRPRPVYPFNWCDNEYWTCC